MFCDWNRESHDRHFFTRYASGSGEATYKGPKAVSPSRRHRLYSAGQTIYSENNISLTYILNMLLPVRNLVKLRFFWYHSVVALNKLH